MQALQWLALSRPVVLDIVQNWELGDADDRRWSASAPLSLQELWRFRKYLKLRELG